MPILNEHPMVTIAVQISQRDLERLMLATGERRAQDAVQSVVDLMCDAAEGCYESF